MRRARSKASAGITLFLVLLQTTSWSAGKALFLTTSDDQPGNVLVNMNTITLETAAEMVRLQFNVRLDGVFGSDAPFRDAFRFGLYHANGTTAQSDQSDGGISDDDRGCFVTLACGESLPLATLQVDGGQAVINGGADVDVLASVSAGHINNQQRHTVVFVIARTDADQLSWDLQIDGIPIIDGHTQPLTVPLNSFNEIVFTSAAGIDMALDNVQVSTNSASGMPSEECLYVYASDFNQDCRVDLDDALRLGSDWLGAYDFADLLQFASDWLSCDNLDIAKCFEQDWSVQ